MLGCWRMRIEVWERGFAEMMFFMGGRVKLREIVRGEVSKLMIWTDLSIWEVRKRRSCCVIKRILAVGSQGVN